MRAYLLSIAGAILVAAIITILIPGGRMGKFIKGLTGLFLLAVILAPFIRGVSAGKFTFPESEAVSEDDGYYERCARMLSERDEAELSDYLAETYGVRAAVDVLRSSKPAFDRMKITIKLSPEGINGEEERIHMVACIREDVETRCGCKAEVS